MFETPTTIKLSEYDRRLIVRAMVAGPIMAQMMKDNTIMQEDGFNEAAKTAVALADKIVQISEGENTARQSEAPQPDSDVN